MYYIKCLECGKESNSFRYKKDIGKLTDIPKVFSTFSSCEKHKLQIVKHG